MDSRSSHNFFDKKMALSLGCALDQILALKMVAANGNELTCNEIYKSFQWKMQGSVYEADFLILPLDNYDMILGIQWLDELGDIMWNFRKLRMTFCLD